MDESNSSSAWTDSFASPWKSFASGFFASAMSKTFFFALSLPSLLRRASGSSRSECKASAKRVGCDDGRCLPTRRRRKGCNWWDLLSHPPPGTCSCTQEGQLHPSWRRRVKRDGLARGWMEASTCTWLQAQAEV